MDNPQPAGQLPVALPVGGQMGETVGLGVRGGAQLALHHLHPVSHRGLEEEPPTVHTHTRTHTFQKQNMDYMVKGYNRWSCCSAAIEFFLNAVHPLTDSHWNKRTSPHSRFVFTLMLRINSVTRLS